jgi:hypothetical protein
MKKIELVLPVLKVTVADISNLRSLASADKVKCVVASRDIDRLRAFGLVETKNLGPCPVEMAKFRKSIATANRLIRKAVRSDMVNWDMVEKARGTRIPEYRKPSDRIRAVPSKAALQLLARGSAKVEIAKSC